MTAPVGRAEVWRSLVAMLDARRSALALISGPPGAGRSHLLRQFGEAAREAGFAVVGCGEPLPIEPTTTIRDVGRALAALVEHPRGAVGPSWVPESPPPETGALRRMLSAVVTRYQDERAVFAALDDAGPVCVGVDGYAPSTTLQLWITTRLLPHLREASSPVLLIAVDSAERLAGIRSAADQVHELGPLDKAEVRAHLAEVAQGLDPPLSAVEIDAYVAAGVPDPAVFAALSTVLSAASRGS